MTACGTLDELVAKQAQAQPDSVALLAPGRTALPYRQLADQVSRIGRMLVTEGMGRRNRVAVALPNGPEMAVAALGVATYATCAPLDPALSEHEFRTAFADLGIDRLILCAGTGPAARNAATAAGVRCVEAIIDETMPAGAFELAAPTAVDVPRAGRQGDIALLLRTSGTTSLPKRVPHSHARLCRSASNIAQTLQLSAADRCLNIMPLFHVHGLVGALLASLHAGASVICTPGLAQGRFVAWLCEFEPTWYTAVPPMHQAVLRDLDQRPRGPLRHRLRFVRSASAGLPPGTAAGLEATLGVPVIEAYGMTEAAHQIASNPLPPGARIAGSVGPAAGPVIAIMDAAGDVLPVRTPGEIVIRGANVIESYDGELETNATAFTKGWLRTGDLGCLDEDGYLRITGRLADLINRGGETISPREVEDALLEHPAVLECAVFAVPHPTLGEDVTAAVVLAPNAAIDVNAVRRSLFGRLSDVRIPSRIVAVDSLPRGSTGKVHRAGMAAWLAAKPGTGFVAPRNELEQQVASLYTQVLDIDTVGVTDNFFVLGGDSLRGGQLLSRVQARFGVQLTLATLFTRPTPGEIADEIGNALPYAGGALVPLLARAESRTGEQAQPLGGTDSARIASGKRGDHASDAK